MDNEENALTIITTEEDEELQWSDDEDTEDKYIMKFEPQIVDTDYFITSDMLIDQPPLIEPETRFLDYKRSYFSGGVQMKQQPDEFHSLNSKTVSSVQQSKMQSYKFNRQLEYPFPKIPVLTFNTISKDVCQLVWSEFIEHGSDESELIKVCHLVSIDNKVTSEIGTYACCVVY
jgi:hypothetical protein